MAYYKDERKDKRLNKSSQDGDNDMGHDSVVPAAGGERATKKPGVASVSTFAKEDERNATTTHKVRDKDQPTAGGIANKTRKPRRRTGKGAKTRKWQKLQTRFANFNNTMEQEHRREASQDQDIDMEYCDPTMVENGAVQEMPQNATFTVAQEDEEDVAETYEARDGNEPPMEKELDDTKCQSGVIERDGEELPVVPGGGEEDADEEVVDEYNIPGAADKAPITNAKKETPLRNMESPYRKFPE